MINPKLFQYIFILSLLIMANNAFSADQYKVNVFTSKMDIAGPVGLSGLDGNVGIGSTSPACKLDLGSGQVCVTGTPVGGGGGSESTTVSDTTTVNLTLTGSDITADLIESGAEGILDLQDLQGAVTDAQVPNNITITNLSGTNTGDQDLTSAGGWTDGGTNIYLTATTDNVGIGTTTPTATLMVNNTGTVDSFRVDDSQTDATPFLITSAGNVGIGTTTASKLFTLGATGQFTIDSNGAIVWASNQANTFTSTSSGNTILALTGNSLTTGQGFAVSSSSAGQTNPLVSLTQSGASSGGTLRVNQSSATSTGRAAHITNAGTFDSFLVEDVASDASPMVVLSDGNVGIGTTFPTQKLQVVGTVLATAFSGDGSALTGLTAGGWTDGGTNVYTATTTDNVGIGTTTPSTTLEIVKQGSQQPLMVSATATGDGNYLIVNSEGNVGIGTVVPQFQLAVAGSSTTLIATEVRNTNASGLAKVRVINDQGDTGEFVCTGSSYAIPRVCGFLAKAGNKATIGEDNGDQNMTIDGTAGNVGIGSTAPNGSLDIRNTTSAIGWTVVDQTDNQACNTGCVSGCVFGFENATGTAVTNIVSCAATTADLCLCAGSN